MDTSTFPEASQQVADGAEGAATPHTAPPAGGLAAELRESLVLLGLAVAVTVGLTTAAQAAVSVLA
jgi:hypothetical protein